MRTPLYCGSGLPQGGWLGMKGRERSKAYLPWRVHEYAERGINPFWGLRQISKYWKYPLEIRDTFWEGPEHLFRICGNTAYTRLPGDWTGSCTIGVIKPAFLLPKESGSDFEVPLYDDLRKTNWKRRNNIDNGKYPKVERENLDLRRNSQNLQTCNLGPRWILGISYSNLYAKQDHSTPSSTRNCFQ